MSLNSLPPSAPARAKVKYINNRELLTEIHNSKKTFCSFLEPEHAAFDYIVHNVKDITPELIEEIRLKKSKPRGKPAVPLDEIPPESIVIRVMTYEHIPLDPDRVRKSRTTGESHAKTTFPPFKHYILRDNGEHMEVCRSHWKGGFQNGEFCAEHGRINNRLAIMFMLLVERYARRGNWRGYCVDEQTEALTQRGWLGVDEITTDDIVLSYKDDQMQWSGIKSVYRDNEYDGKMFKMTSRGFDALVTPGHKWITKRGPLVTDHLMETDRIILMGNAVEGSNERHFSDEFVELMGWVTTEGSFYRSGNSSLRLTIYQNEGKYSDRIRHCLNTMGEKFSEFKRRNANVAFTINSKLTKNINQYIEEFGNKALKSDFLLKLTSDQRELLLNTMLDGDGWRTEQNGSVHRGYAQKCKKNTDSFVMLCTLAGYRTSTHKTDSKTKVNNKETHIHVVNVLGQRANIKRIENVNMYGAKRTGRDTGKVGTGKINHPNIPTVDYKGTVWCLETDVGSFICRRNGSVYLTHNSYNDEMQSQAILQLSQIGLQFDESKSDNPFAFYTTTIKNSFTRILNLEKKVQNIRDDMLIIAGTTPSYTRQIDNELEYRFPTETTAAKAAKKPAKATKAPKKPPVILED